LDNMAHLAGYNKKREDIAKLGFKYIKIVEESK